MGISRLGICLMGLLVGCSTVSTVDEQWRGFAPDTRIMLGPILDYQTQRVHMTGSGELARTMLADMLARRGGLVIVKPPKDWLVTTTRPAARQVLNWARSTDTDYVAYGQITQWQHARRHRGGHASVRLQVVILAAKTGQVVCQIDTEQRLPAGRPATDCLRLLVMRIVNELLCQQVEPASRPVGKH